MRKRTVITPSAACVAFGLALAPVPEAQAQNTQSLPDQPTLSHDDSLPRGSFLVTNGRANPIGAYSEMCDENRQGRTLEEAWICAPADDGGRAVVRLTPRLYEAIASINRGVNGSIEGKTDWQIYNQEDKYVAFSLSVLFGASVFQMLPNGSLEQLQLGTPNGDCEEYALTKMLLLEGVGIPREAMRLTVVRDENNEGHAVLVLRTDRGDLVLDNKHGETWTVDQAIENRYKFSTWGLGDRWEALLPDTVERLPDTHEIHDVEEMVTANYTGWQHAILNPYTNITRDSLTRSLQVASTAAVGPFVGHPTPPRRPAALGALPFDKYGAVTVRPAPELSGIY